MRTLSPSSVDAFFSALPDQVKGAFYSLVEPTPTGTEPQLVAFSPEVAAQIGLDPEEAQRPEFAAAMSGNAPMPNAAGWALASSMLHGGSRGPPQTTVGQLCGP